MRFPTHAEVARLGEGIDTRYQALMLVAAYCGLRAGELIALQRSNVDLDHHTITVVEQVQCLRGRFEVLPPKTAAGRRAASLPSIVAESWVLHLLAYAEPGPAGIVFPAPEGGYLRLENFRRRVWEPAVASAGLAPLRLHDMRHCCASLAIAAGADVKVLQRMLGHASAALTLDPAAISSQARPKPSPPDSTSWPARPAVPRGRRPRRPSQHPPDEHHVCMNCRSWSPLPPRRPPGVGVTGQPLYTSRRCPARTT